MTEGTQNDPGAKARADMSERGRRGYEVVRHVAVQLPREAGGDRGSTLGKLLRGRKHRALVLYLMLLWCWPWLQQLRKPLPAPAWVRALTTSKGPLWSTSTLSRVWGDLESAGLIERAREGKGGAVRVTPRREDGGAPYEAPGGRRDRWNTYFVIPDEFWTEELFAKLTFPGLAMFLIIAKETSGQDECVLPYDRLSEWYGVSARSAQNGVKDLETHGLLHRREERVDAPLSALGFTTRVHYSLTGPYGHQAREALQKRAKSAGDRRRRQASGAAKATSAKRVTGKKAPAKKTAGKSSAGGATRRTTTSSRSTTTRTTGSVARKSSTSSKAVMRGSTRVAE